MFRNVRTEPRKFSLRSRHLPELDEVWMERKRRIDQSFDDPEDVPRRPIKMRRPGPIPPSERLARKREQIQASRWSMVRASIIAAALVWLSWKALQWVENSDFSNLLKWMEDA
jgi:hypothetical protein